MSATVLLHGWGMNQGVWQLIENEIKNVVNEPVKNLDLPGFGFAQQLPENYNLASAAALLAQKIPDNSRIIGWSLGGLFAIYLARHYPTKVREVVLVAATPYFQQSEDWHGIKAQVLEQFMLQLKQAHTQTVERFLAIQAMGSESAKSDIKKIKSLLTSYPSAQLDALAAGLEILKHADLRHDFSKLTIPIYGIYGRLDGLVPRRALKKIEALNPNYRLDVLDKASHAPFISHPQQFIESLCTLLKVKGGN